MWHIEPERDKRKVKDIRATEASVYDVKGKLAAITALSVVCIPGLPYAKHHWEPGPTNAG